MTERKATRGCFVGFDTSNYTTSAAVVSDDGRVIANLKRPLPVKEGQRGLRQSDAVFEHVRNLPDILCELREVLRKEELNPLAVGVSVTPRDAEGSYMPCFLSGKAAAYSFSAAVNAPIYEFSHQNGHVMAAAYSSGAMTELMTAPFVAFHVSGGTTEALYVEPAESGLKVTTVGETDDINAGQLIDRVGVALGLRFPCGIEMERLAAEYVGKIRKHPICVRNIKCSLSGAENIALKIYKETEDKTAAAAFVFDFICRTLIEMGAQTEEKFGKTRVLFAGGVMSNRLMRKRLSERFCAYYAEPQFSADNAAGIALLCKREYEK
ncbi:MAG: peptidase M22 [Ruminococcaceae bacterium]|nr:peptidase M22 [Oscillospiraceae bacterium]